MVRRQQKSPKNYLVLHVIAVLFALAGILMGIASIEGAFKEVIVASAGLAMPQKDTKSSSANTKTTSSAADMKDEDDPISFERPDILPLNAQGSSSISSSSKISSSQASFSGIPNGSFPIQEKTFTATNDSSYLNYNGITIYKKTKQHTVDIKKVLAETPDVHIKNNKKPQVLIVHTHTTENYIKDDRKYYLPSEIIRSTDPDRGVMRVGDMIKKELEAAGIVTIHDKTLNDYPSYNGSYNRNITTIKNNLKKYPTIQVVLDVHRDSITYSNGTKVKPVATVNGKKVSQMMIISGCNEEGALPFPDWEYNMRLAVRIQKDLLGVAPNFARPIQFSPTRYDMHMTHGSLLVEFGTDVNTQDEVDNAGTLFGKSLAKTLKSLT